MIIFDLDSTLVDTRRCTQLMGDWDAYNDELNKCCSYEALAAFIGYFTMESIPVVLITGRSEKLRGDITQWLQVEGIDSDELLMRPDLNGEPEPELFKRLLEPIIPIHRWCWGITGKERIAEAFRELGIQSLLATRLITTSPEVAE